MERRKGTATGDPGGDGSIKFHGYGICDNIVSGMELYQQLSGLLNYGQIPQNLWQNGSNSREHDWSFYYK